MRYTAYTAKDFLLDDAFLEWVLHPNQANSYFWEKWIQAYPEKRPEIEEARLLVAEMQQPLLVLPEARVDQIWGVIAAETVAEKESASLQPELDAPAGVNHARGTRLVAIFIGLLVAGAAFWHNRPGRELLTVVAAGYSQVRLSGHSVVVPDGNATSGVAPDLGEEKAGKNDPKEKLAYPCSIPAAISLKRLYPDPVSLAAPGR